MKIKTSIYSHAALALLGGVANAQNNSATDPVGFHTLTAYGNGGSGERFSLLAPGLVNPIEYASAATAITVDTITVDGTPFAGLDFGSLPNSDGGASYYVEITGDSNDPDPDDADYFETGAWANIVSNTDGSLTLDRDLSDAGQTSKIAIRKHVTLEDLFGAANEAGLDDGGSLAAADEITLFSSLAPAKVYFYFNNGAQEGWATAAGQPAANAPIEPQQGVYVKRKVAGDAVFTRAGHVKVGATKLSVNAGFNALANPRAVGEDDADMPVFTLDSSNLHSDDAANSVDGGTTLSAADEVTVFLPGGGFGVFFYFDNGAGLEGWADGGGNPSGDFVLENGTGFILNRKNSGPFVWTVPAETIAD